MTKLEGKTLLDRYQVQEFLGRGGLLKYIRFGIQNVCLTWR